MRISFKNLDPKIKKIVKTITTIAQKEDLNVYMVGGIVRDMLLKRKNLDLDIIVDGDHLKLVKALENIWDVKAVVYPQFLTARLYAGPIRVDIARVRKEHYPRPGILPVVTSGTLRDDLLRRDFSINALAVDLKGEPIDFFGGIEDLKNKNIRVLHDKSFMDDPTRILRALRFCARFNFKIEQHTLTLLRKAIVSDVYQTVSPNRLFIEFSKNFLESDPWLVFDGIKRLNAFGFLHARYVYPVQLMAKIKAFLGKDFLKKANVSLDEGLVLWMGLLCNVSPQILDQIVKKFPFKIHEKKAMLEFQKWPAVRAKLAQSRKRSEAFELLRPLSGETVILGICLEKNKSIKSKLITFIREDRTIKLEITGEDLKQLGVAEGSKIGKIMRQLLADKLDRRIDSKKAEWQEARRLALM